ncbi:MAG TPA: hypothetical protein VF214_06795 [Edaphobacter sp.]
MRVETLQSSVSAPQSRLERWFADERRFWLLSTFFLGLLASLKGLRRPSLWAVTQAQLDYSSGFVKRGLMGQIYSSLGIHHYATLAVCFYIILTVFLLTLALFVRSSRIAERNGTWAIVALFTGSYAMTYLVHLAGYTDILNGILTLAALLARPPSVRFVLSVLVTSIAMLIHENFLILFLPILLFSFALQAAADRRLTRQCIAYAVSLAVLALGLAVVTSTKARMTPEQTVRIRAHMLSDVDFPLEEEFFMVPSLSLWKDIKHTLEIELVSIRWRREVFIAPFVLLPCFAVFLRRCFALLHKGSAHKASIKAPPLPLLQAAILVVIFAPLTLHLMGFDAMRWNVMCVFNAFLALACLSMYWPGEDLSLGTAERNLFILIIAIGMASGYGLLDKSVVKPYPFFPDNTGMFWNFIAHGVLPPPQ